MKSLPGMKKTKALFKQKPEDFLVEEILPFKLSGDGHHTYLFIEKTNISTFEAVDTVAEAAGCSPRDIGYAGLKDKNAVTRQYISIPCEPPALDHPQLRILSSTRHNTKLKKGKLYGNKFKIILRNVENPSNLREAFPILSKRGAPNYYGPQRFGALGKNHEIGKALLLSNYQQALAIFLLANGRQEAYARKLAERLKPRQVWKKLPRRLPQLFLNALQSHLFNAVLDRRIETFDKLLPGDLAMVGNRFTKVEKPEDFAGKPDFSPSGPLFGRKVPLAQGEPGRIENQVLANSALTLSDFAKSHLDGYRRPLRLQLINPSLKLENTTATLEFTLKKGGYATAILAQLIEETI